MMENVLLKSEDKRSRSEIVTFLKEIAVKIDSGTVKLVQGEQSLELEIPENLTLEIKVEEKIKPNKPKKMLRRLTINARPLFAFLLEIMISNSYILSLISVFFLGITFTESKKWPYV